MMDCVFNRILKHQ